MDSLEEIRQMGRAQLEARGITTHTAPVRFGLGSAEATFYVVDRPEGAKVVIEQVKLPSGAILRANQLASQQLERLRIDAFKAYTVWNLKVCAA